MIERVKRVLLLRLLTDSLAPTFLGERLFSLSNMSNAFNTRKDKRALWASFSPAKVSP